MAAQRSTGVQQGSGAQRNRFTGRPAGDTGEADPVVAAALGEWAGGAGSEHDALLALAGARLLVPVVAVLTEQDAETGADKESEMALPTLIGADGRPAIIAFTGVESVRRWRADARPIPVPASRVWQAAVAHGGAATGGAAASADTTGSDANGAAVVIDVAGPVPFVVEGARLAALAAGEPPPPAYLDPDIRAAIEAVIAGEPAITGFTLDPGADTALAVTLRLTDPAGVAPARRAARAIAAALAPRLRQDVTLSAGLCQSLPGRLTWSRRLVPVVAGKSLRRSKSLPGASHVRGAGRASLAGARLM